MPNSPNVKIGFENQNVQTSAPSLGVSHVLARTTKGSFNDPSKLIRNISQFRDVYGSEIVPDGTISNIEKALSGGSTLRICRVPGGGIEKAVALSAVYDEADGVVYTDSLTVVTDDIGDSFKIVITMGDSRLIEPINKTVFTLEVAMRTKEYTDYPNKLIKVKLNTNGLLVVELYSNVYRYTDVNPTNLVESIPVMLLKTVDVAGKYVITDVDTSRFSSLLNNQSSTNLEFVIGALTKSTTTVGTVDTVTPLTTVTGLLNYIDHNRDRFKYGTADTIGYGNEDNTGSVFTEGLIYLFDGGNTGIASTPEDWIASIEYLRDYVDAYQITCSHLSQHLIEADAKEVHIAMANFVNEVEELVYYIDIPKYKTPGTPMVYSELIAWVIDMITTIGHSKYVAYFGGGYKYYNSTGVLKNCDNIGTILGLGDACATAFGPWYHFSGVNRGLVTESVGPVSPNYGSPSNYNKLNEIANAYINMSVVKDTRSMGKQTMLFHNFTSQVLDNSEKFLGIVRLNLYLKKLLRPILESYIEEPNTFSTWNSLYYIVKPLLDKLVGSAMVSYTWYGDQFATSFKDMEVNKEADVRVGKYLAKLSYIDIVAMQEIVLSVTIDAVAGSVTISKT